MEKGIVKEGYEQANKELKDKQVATVKEIVLKTLEKLDGIKQQIRGLREKEKVLEMDLDDLKAGKLDRIAERQLIDPEAKATSVVIIIKEREVVHPYSPWYWPYQVVWQVPVAPSYYITCDSTSNGSAMDSTLTWSNSGTLPSCPTLNSCSSNNTTGYAISASAAKDYAVGTYLVSSRTVHFR
jgi:regulator of replication initiation timing